MKLKGKYALAFMGRRLFNTKQQKEEMEGIF